MSFGKLILYQPPANQALAELFGGLKRGLKNIPILSAGSLDEFKGMLLTGADSRIVAVLPIETPENLETLMGLNSFLQRIDLILLIPGGDDQLKNRARKLRPRYIVNWPDEFSELSMLVEAAVGKIQRLTGKQKSQ